MVDTYIKEVPATAATNSENQQQTFQCNYSTDEEKINREKRIAQEKIMLEGLLKTFQEWKKQPWFQPAFEAWKKENNR